MVIGMFLLTGVLLLCKIVLADLRFDPHENCDFYTKLTSENVTLYNPLWPAAYSAGLMCRWTYDCPIWHSCLLQCRDLGLPQTRGCYMDKLLVSQAGDQYFSDAQMYCGRDVINYKSVGSKIVIALITHPLSPGGRFICTLRAELWSQQFTVAHNLAITAPRKKIKKSRRKKGKNKKGNIKLASVPEEDLTLPKITRIEHARNKLKIQQNGNRTKIDHGEYIHAKLQHGKYLNAILQEKKCKPKKSKQEKHQHSWPRCGFPIKTTSEPTQDSTEPNNEIEEQTEQIEKQMQEKRTYKLRKSNYKRYAKLKSYGRCEEINPPYEDQPLESLIDTQQTDSPNRKREQIELQYETYKPSKLYYATTEQDIVDTEYKQVESLNRDPVLAEPMYKWLVVAKPQAEDLNQTETREMKSQVETQAQVETQIRETWEKGIISEATEPPKDIDDECLTSQQGMLQTTSQQTQTKSRHKKKKHRKMRYREKEKQDQGRLLFKWNLQNDLMKKMQVNAVLTYEGREPTTVKTTTTSTTIQKDIKLTPSSEIKQLQEKLSNVIAKSFKSANGSSKVPSINFKYVKKIIVVRSVKRRRTTTKMTKENVNKHNVTLVPN